MRLFLNLFTKKCLSESKKGIRDFSLNSNRSVITPSWRKIGSKKCHHFLEQIALFYCIKFRFANFNTFIKNKFYNFKKECEKMGSYDDVFLSYIQAGYPYDNFLEKN